MQSYSKGARGLSVLPRVDCIITNISTSLSLGWRQRGHRYTIRAGRNLPDKEFRYLRTVIVTAAVYRGFDQELAPHHLTFRHRAGITPYTSTFVFAECCVFNKQSQPPILCNPVGLQLYAFTFEPGQPTPGAPNLLRPHIASGIGTGILTRFPSTTHFCLALGADSPCADERCAGNLVLTASGPFTRFIATHVSSRTSDTSSVPDSTPSQAYGTLSYQTDIPKDI